MAAALREPGRRGEGLTRSAAVRKGAVLRRAPALLVLVLLAASTAGGSQGEPEGDGGSLDYTTRLGTEVRVPAGERVTQDLLAIAAPVVVDGESAADAVVIGGDLIVRGRVEGDALAIGGRVRLARGARVDGNAFSLFGGVDLADGASVGGRVRSLAPLLPGQEAGYLTVAFARPVLLARFLGLVFWLLAALIATFIAPSTVARSAAELGRHPLRLALIGALLALSFALSLVLSVALIPVFVGIPMLVLLVLLALAIGAVGLAAAFQAVGERIGDRLRERALSGYVELLTGALVLGLLHFVPILGELTWGLAGLLGSGAVVATRLGRSARRSA